MDAKTAALREALIEAAKQGLRGEPRKNRKNPLYQKPTEAAAAWTHLYGTCRAFAEWATDENLALAEQGRLEREDDQSSNIGAVREATAILQKLKID